MARYKYPYTCPSCGAYFEFRMRTVLKLRRCSYCGTPVTVEEIDRQARLRAEHARLLARRERLHSCGCMAVFVVLTGLALKLVVVPALFRPQAPSAAPNEVVEVPSKPRQSPSPEVAEKAAYALSVAQNLE